MWASLGLLVLLSGLIGPIWASDACNSKLNCGACISTANCVWCSQKSANQAPQCQSETATANTNWCPKNSTENPPSKYQLIQANRLKTESTPFIQISPQKIEIKTRPGKKIDFKLGYAQAFDYPLDLYYLMDLSQSMKDDKDKLSNLGNQLAERMRVKSSNLRMGFGSFVDKRTMPFVNTFNGDLIPCTDCAPAYSFINHLKLTNDTNQFAQSVRQTRMSGNIDYPEGGLDALMQVMVCDKQIGWRKDALHMIIFSTDAESHYAGDGKLGGIVEPNDEQCHLDKNQSYDYDLLQDYPSIAQISNKAYDRKMSIIFAVTKSVQETYEKLSLSIYGSQTGVLADNSDNVVLFVEEAYDKLTQRVNIEHNAKPPISLQFKSSCLGSGPPQETKQCSDIRKRGDTVSFDVSLEVTACPANKTEWRQQFEIYPQSVSSQKLVVDLEIDCECGCEKPGQFSANDAGECNAHGDFKCGTCVCGNGWWGAKCNCNSASSTQDESNFASCQPKDAESDEVCNGRGNCRCEQCNCRDKRYSGRFCECDSESCPKNSDKLICSGPDHGQCECGTCACKRGWTGPSCSCSTSKDSCMDPGKNEICSGRGECKCGSCSCNSIPAGGRYTGSYCEECPTCPGKCDELQECVEIDVYQPGQEKLQCINYTLHQLDDLTKTAMAEALTSHRNHKLRKRELDTDTPLLTGDFGEQSPSTEASETSRLCSYPDKQGCTYYFRYTIEDKLLHVFAKKGKECGEPVDIMGVVFGLIGAILLAGIVMLIIWKIATSIHDKREFAKFEKEREAAMWDAGHNPLYKEPASTFQNPTFSGK